MNLGTLKEIKDLREVWPHEAHDFTPWLAKNISVLGDEIGIDISIEETESSIGAFNVDIFATDADTGKKIIIKNSDMFVKVLPVMRNFHSTICCSERI